jgi:hypothetical protein
MYIQDKFTYYTKNFKSKLILGGFIDSKISISPIHNLSSLWPKQNPDLTVNQGFIHVKSISVIKLIFMILTLFLVDF